MHKLHTHKQEKVHLFYLSSILTVSSLLHLIVIPSFIAIVIAVMCRIKMKALKLIRVLEFFYPFSQKLHKNKEEK